MRKRNALSRVSTGVVYQSEPGLDLFSRLVKPRCRKSERKDAAINFSSDPDRSPEAPRKIRLDDNERPRREEERSARGRDAAAARTKLEERQARSRWRR